MRITSRTALTSTLVACAALLGGFAWRDLAAAHSCTVAGLPGASERDCRALAEMVVGDEDRSPRTVEILNIETDQPEEQAAATRRAPDGTLVELATWLASGEPSRAEWETALRASTASMHGSCAEALLQASSDPERPALECVAALELLRVLTGDTGASAPESAVARLRVILQGGEIGATAASAAARALARFGDPADRLALVATLPGSDSERAHAAAWGLREAQASEVAGELARLLDETVERSAAGPLAAAILEELARDPDELERAALRNALHPVAADPAISAVARRRAVAILGRAGGSAETELLLGLLLDPGTEEDLARTSADAVALLQDNSAVERLAAALARPELDAERRMLAAEAIARSASRDGEASWADRAAADHLAEVARTSPNSGLRRRSIAALGNLCGPSTQGNARDVACLAELAQVDADPRVRDAATRALESIAAPSEPDAAHSQRRAPPPSAAAR